MFVVLFIGYIVFPPFLWLIIINRFCHWFKQSFPSFCTLCTDCILHCTWLLSLSWSRPNSFSHRKSEFVKENEKWRGTYWRLFKSTPQQHHEDDKNQQSLNWTQTFLIAEKWLTLRLLFNTSNAEDVCSFWSLPTEHSSISSFRFIRISRYNMNTYPMWISTLESGVAWLRSVTEIAPELSTVCMCEQNFYPVWFSCRRESYPVSRCEQSLCWKPF